MSKKKKSKPVVQRHEHHTCPKCGAIVYTVSLPAVREEQSFKRGIQVCRGCGK